MLLTSTVAPSLLRLGLEYINVSGEFTPKLHQALSANRHGRSSRRSSSHAAATDPHISSTRLRELSTAISCIKCFLRNHEAPGPSTLWPELLGMPKLGSGPRTCRVTERWSGVCAASSHTISAVANQLQGFFMEASEPVSFLLRSCDQLYYSLSPMPPCLRSFRRSMLCLPAIRFTILHQVGNQ